MILKSIRLKNIRSYLEENIDFSKGSTLLHGDVGSGKSTILLSLEFALFGLIKGSVSGSTLLRHGENNGEVELDFKLNNKLYTVNRSLKKGQTISQNSGFLKVDGLSKEGTTTELTTWIMEILGYPKDLVTKNKSLIFRYTVYTPQEEMKEILMQNKETRLDILRKVFGFDKYKKIKDNASIFLRGLREKIRSLKSSVVGFEDRKKDFEKKNDDLLLVGEKIKQVKIKFEEIKNGYLIKKKIMEEIEGKVKEYNERKNKIKVYEIEVKNTFSKREEIKDEIVKLEGEISNFTGEIVEFIELNKDELNQYNLNLGNAEKRLMELIGLLSEVKVKRSSAEEIISKITNLDHCPLCMQNVNDNHKQNVSNEQNKILNEHGDKEKDLLIERVSVEEKILLTRKKIDDIKEIEKRNEIVKLKIKNIDEKKLRLEGLRKKIDQLKQVIQEKSKEKAEMQIGMDNKIEEEFFKIKNQYEVSRENTHKIELELMSFQKEKENIFALLEIIKKDVKRMIEARVKIEKLSKYNNWFNDFFLNVVDVIERQVLIKVHREFNGMFKKWFDALVEDEDLNARIDGEFSPILVQNGYETSIDNLSGGEKTSCALAYRLALNMVINKVVSSINTRDLIILDEPTDGFSTEQLSRMREVLYDLNLGQVIIVSHEEEIESFVDNVVKLRKESHVSEVCKP